MVAEIGDLKIETLLQTLIPLPALYPEFVEKIKSRQENGSNVNVVPKTEVKTQGGGQGREKNNREPDSTATGDHSVINQNGSTTYKRNE